LEGKVESLKKERDDLLVKLEESEGRSFINILNRRAADDNGAAPVVSGCEDFIWPRLKEKTALELEVEN
jgi:hypothetical protein